MHEIPLCIAHAETPQNLRLNFETNIHYPFRQSVARAACESGWNMDSSFCQTALLANSLPAVEQGCDSVTIGDHRHPTYDMSLGG